MLAPVSSFVGLALIVMSIPLDQLAKATATAPNGASLLAVLAIIGGFLVIILGNERAYADRRRAWPLVVRRGPYVLENVGNVYVFGDTRLHRSTMVGGLDDLVTLRRFIEADATYVLDGDRVIVERYLARLTDGVTA